MKILYPISEITPSYGGIGAYVYKTIKMLLRNYQDYEAVIITSNQQQEDTFSHYFQNVDRVKVISLFERRYSYIFLRDIHFQLKLARKIKKLIKNEEIDIVHHQTGHYDLFFSIICLESIPVVMTSHGDLYTLLKKWKKAPLSNFNERVNYYFGKLLYNEEKLLYNKSDKIIAVADHVREQIINHYNIKSDKIITNHNFVDAEQFNFHPGGFRKPYKIGFLGRPYYIKGFFDLIKILNKYQNDDTFEWHIVSDIDLVKKSVRNTEHIRFYRNIPQSNLSEFYDNIDCMFVPSYSEASPTVVIESLLKGKLCIVRNVTGIQEIMKECNGVFFTDIAQLDFMDIFNKYTSDSGNLSEMLMENRENTKKTYGSPMIVNDIYKLYKDYYQ